MEVSRELLESGSKGWAKVLIGQSLYDSATMVVNSGGERERSEEEGH